MWNVDQKRARGFTLIEILVVIGLIAILAAIVLIAINPARQFRQARDSQRVSNVNAILNAVGQYLADHKGVLPTGITTTKQNIKNDGANICADLVPTYLPQLPSDPSATAVASPCPATYDAGYRVVKDAAGRVTVSADGEEPAGTDNISITR
jgi:type IV pilus assembly protein PilA